MEKLLLGIGLVAIYWTWRAWKRTALDSCRDALFDIRDDARRYFISRNIPLDSKLYVALRYLLNSHIRYAKKMTFPRFVATVVAMQNHSDVMRKMRGELDSALKTDDPELAAYIAKVRQSSSEAMMAYIGQTSATLLSIIVLSLPLYGIFKSIKVTYQSIQEQHQRVSAGCLVMYKSLLVVARAIPLTVVGLVIAMPARAGMIERELSSATILEELSYEDGLAHCHCS